MTSSTAARSVRDRLIDAAEVCLRAKGIRATTVSEVAEVAEVSRGWLYRHFPDKASLLGAAIVRLNEAYWSEVHAMLEPLEGLDRQITTGVVHARTAYDDPGTLLMRLRMEEPEEFAACAGAGVQGLVPDLAALLAALCGRPPSTAARSTRTPTSTRRRNGWPASSSRWSPFPATSSTRAIRTRCARICGAT